MLPLKNLTREGSPNPIQLTRMQQPAESKYVQLLVVSLGRHHLVVVVIQVNRRKGRGGKQLM